MMHNLCNCRVKGNGSHILASRLGVKRNVVGQLGLLSGNISGGIITLRTLDLETQNLGRELEDLVGDFGVLFHLVSHM